MPKPTKDTQIQGIERLRRIAKKDPQRALVAFLKKIFRGQRSTTNEP